MEMIENGMVVGADREYAKMYEDTSADDAMVIDFLKFAWDTECANEVMADAFGFDKSDLAEDIAELIFSGLPGDFVAECVKDWASSDDVRERYNKYTEGN